MDRRLSIIIMALIQGYMPSPFQDILAEKSQKVHQESLNVRKKIASKCRVRSKNFKILTRPPAVLHSSYS